MTNREMLAKRFTEKENEESLVLMAILTSALYDRQSLKSAIGEKAYNQWIELLDKEVEA